MPTNRTKRRRVHKPSLNAAQLAYLSDNDSFIDDGFDKIELMDMRSGRAGHGMVDYRAPEQLWKDNRDTYLSKFILHNPGSGKHPN